MEKESHLIGTKFQNQLELQREKRPIGIDAIDNFVSKIIMKVKVLVRSEVPTSTIGKLIMEGLQYLDTVAYVHFASVYKNLKRLKDFEHL